MSDKGDCKCGCGERVSAPRRYVDKEHQISHLLAGEARRLNDLQSPEAKKKGGAIAGRRAVESGRLATSSKKGAARVREIAEEMRRRRSV